MQKTKYPDLDENIPHGIEGIPYNCFLLWNRLMRNRDSVNQDENKKQTEIKKERLQT